MIGFALCHGWGFDAHAMDMLAEGLRKHFPASPVFSCDLGFTGKPHVLSDAAAEDGDVRWIALGHSYGFAWLMQQKRAWHAAISVNGFTRFCRRPGKPEGTPVRVLDNMIARLASDPQATVADFRVRCGAGQEASDSLRPPDDAVLNAELLGAHLEQLRNLDLPAPTLPTLSLSTRRDLIVPSSLTQACFAKAGCTMEEYEGSHLQLLHEPQRCMAAIQSFVEAIA